MFVFLIMVEICIVFTMNVLFTLIEFDLKYPQICWVWEEAGYPGSHKSTSAKSSSAAPVASAKSTPVKRDFKEVLKFKRLKKKSDKRLKFASRLRKELPYSMKFLWHFNFAVFEKPQNLSGVKFWWRKNLRLQKFHIGQRGRTLKQFHRVQAY